MNLRQHINIGSLILIFSLLSVYPQHKVYSNDAPKKKDVFTVVIDAGHGGHDSGAIGNNVKEKDINLGVAKKLAAKIKKQLKDVKVVMTRDNDTFVTLQNRAKIANENKGNLFISIHTNSLDKSNPNRKKVSGASVYALGLHKDQSNLQVARRENSVIELEKNFEQKYSGFDPSKDESYIIFEMAQKKNLGQSLKFADLAQKSLVKEAKRADRGVKQAGFWVLWATSMPAVLVELDFICNPNSAVYMGSEKGQSQLADALCKAIEKYVGNKNLSMALIAENKADNKSVTDSAQEMPVLTSSKTSEKKIEPVRSTHRPASALTKRRRRSESAKKASAIRNVETAAIPLHRENERLAIIEKQEPEPVYAAEETTVEMIKKGKSQAKKKKSEKKQQKNGSRTYNNKKVVVNSDGSTELTDKNVSSGIKPKTHKSISGYHSKVEKLKTVYKIQILASADILKQNNPRFCGLAPIKSFKENNLYKYTYGESENKRDMEMLLKKVKEKIPDAFIIKSIR